MIKLTDVQRQTALALAKLTKSSHKLFFTVEEICQERLFELGKEDTKGTYTRTTWNALKQIHEMVPAVISRNGIGAYGGWRFTDVGRVMARTQLGVDL